MSTSELVWFKSSYSGSQGDDCVEVANEPGTVHVRDSKDVRKQPFAVHGTAWTTFVAYAAQS